MVLELLPRGDMNIVSLHLNPFQVVPHRNPSDGLHCKSNDWFMYDTNYY